MRLLAVSLALSMALASGAVAVSAPAGAAPPIPSSGPPPSPGAPDGPDADDDGLPDEWESLFRTDPADPDSDDDGLLDGNDPSGIVAYVESLPDVAFRSASTNGLRQAMTARLHAAEEAFLVGEFAEGHAQLANLQRRVDGCPPRPDRNDWVVDCDVAATLLGALQILATNHVTVAVDPMMTTTISELPGLGEDRPRPVGAAQAPDGAVEEFVADELIVRQADARLLADLLADVGGTVVRDLAPRLAEPGEPGPKPAELEDWYLVRFDPTAVDPTELADRMEAAGFRGAWTFSSDAARGLFATAFAHAGTPLSLNYLLSLGAVNEHPADDGSPIAADGWWWMTEDDDLSVPGEQGISVGVIRAWEYLKYQGVPMPGVPFYPVVLAVIDSGFDLDETTGEPNQLAGGDDYLPTRPPQLDEVDYDVTAGGIGTGFSNCSGCWHGQSVYGLSAGFAGNGYGTAGTSAGLYIEPLVIKVTGDFWIVAAGVKDALYNNADVISMSIAGDCGWTCEHFSNGNVLAAAIGSAIGHGAIVVAAANNQGQDISGKDMIPCELAGAICVGAVDENGNRKGYSNYGSVVDIWAPAGIRTSPTRDSADDDTNDTGIDELYHFEGTSAATPYTAGIVALMRMLNGWLTVSQARTILQSTANNSTDALVTPGYVDAYRAVAAVRPNQPPTAQFLSPTAGLQPYTDVYISAQVVDPETPTPFWFPADFSSEIVIESNLDGELCRFTRDATGSGTTVGCTVAALTPGTHALAVRVTDPFGAVGADFRQVIATNTPPAATITYPPDGAVFTANQQVNLRGVGLDPDEALTGANLGWNSSLSGDLGAGSERWEWLAEGTHVITLRAVDSLGAMGTDAITIEVIASDGRPTVRIDEPAHNTTVPAGTVVTFRASGSDPEDGALPSTAFAWRSSLDNDLGIGSEISVVLSGSVCGLDRHDITVTATDSDGHTATHTIVVLVGTIC